IFRESREYCKRECQEARSVLKRKFFYLFTCEFCFSYYVTILFLIITRYKLLYSDWRGYLLALFALVWVANQYMSIYNRLRLDIKHEQVDIKVKEKKRRTCRSAKPPESLLHHFAHVRRTFSRHLWRRFLNRPRLFNHPRRKLRRTLWRLAPRNRPVIEPARPFFAHKRVRQAISLIAQRIFQRDEPVPALSDHLGQLIEVVGFQLIAMQQQNLFGLVPNDFL